MEIYQLFVFLLSIILVWLFFIKDEKFLSLVPKVIRTSTIILVSNTEFVIGIVSVIIAEIVVFQYLGASIQIQMHLIVISVYLLFTFWLYCNVFQVGPRREAMWTTLFLILCLTSLYLFQQFRLEFILPVSIVSTILLCYFSTKDDNTFYIFGLFYLYDFHQADQAIICFKKAIKIDNNNPFYLYHLGRSYIAMGKKDKGAALIKKVMNNDFMSSLKTSPLFRQDWIINTEEQSS
jgi:tetratricopeptide (TPR) repeat protein